MTDPQRSLAQLAEFARRLAESGDVLDAMQQLSLRMRDALGATGSSVSLLVEGELRVVATGDATDAGLGAVHVDGPSWAAAQTQAPVLVPRLAAHAEEWPFYCRAAAEYGTVAVAAFPLHADEVLGTVEVYDQRVHDWDASEVCAAQAFADIAAAQVRSARELESQRKLAAQLEKALASRVIVEQAKGIVAAHRSVTPERAFTILRKHADDHNVPLRRVAEAVVRLGLRP